MGRAEDLTKTTVNIVRHMFPQCRQINLNIVLSKEEMEHDSLGKLYMQQHEPQEEIAFLRGWVARDRRDKQNVHNTDSSST